MPSSSGSGSSALRRAYVHPHNNNANYLAELPREEYLDLLNHTIAAFAACARQVGSHFFDKPLLQMDSKEERTSAVKKLLAYSIELMGEHAVRVGTAIQGQAAPLIDFRFVNEHGDELQSPSRSIPLCIPENAVPSGQDVADILRKSYRSILHRRLGTTVSETINLNFG